VNIIACVKQVPDTEAQIKVKADGSGIEEGQIKWVMNPYDEFGVEEALKLKEKNGGDVTIVSVGPALRWKPSAPLWPWARTRACTSAIRRLTMPTRMSSPTLWRPSYKTLPHDIIFCGQRAIDDDAGQVGAMLAEALGLPQLTLVTKLEFAGASVKVIRPIEGAQLSIETALPCIVTAQKGLNERGMLLFPAS
jgi:electron transfer flavoprotein beta subunit